MQLDWTNSYTPAPAAGPQPPTPSDCSNDPVRFARERLGFHPDPQQELVLATSAPRVILNCSRQWGKSTVTSIKAVYHAFTQPGSLVLVASPGLRQSAEFVHKAAAHLARLGIPRRGDGHNRISLLLPNRSRIVGLPGLADAARGFSAVTLLIIDEAARAHPDLYRTLRPSLAVSGGGLWLISTPAGRRGFFWDAWRRSAPAPAPEWLKISVPATACPRIPAWFLDEERAEMGEEWFAQEYLCEFADREGCVFDRELIEAALDPDLEPLF